MKYMNCLLIMICLTISSMNVYAITWNIEVGGELGSTTNPPYYNPQYLEVTEGDVVQWNWVSGPHNVTSTAGPLFFSSGNLNAGESFNVTFSVSAFYTYANTIGNASNTAYGTIFVLPLITGVSPHLDPSSLDQVELVYSAMNNSILMKNPTSQDVLALWYDAQGRIVFSQQVIALDSQIKTAPELQSGIYIVFLRSSRAIRTKKIFVP